MEEIDDEAQIVHSGDSKVNTVSATAGPEQEEEEENIQDWKAFNKQVARSAASLAPSSEAIPARGEKDFEPDGTTVQNSLLDESRNEMYAALLGLRGHPLKSTVTAVWIPSEGKALILHAKGNFFKDIGKPVHIPLIKKAQGVWLSPVETVYLVERGSVICYLSNDEFENYLKIGGDEGFDYRNRLRQLTLSHVYSLAFCVDGDLIDKYQVYSYLKRSGYIVQDFRLITPEQSQSLALLHNKKRDLSSLGQHLIRRLCGFFSFPIFNKLVSAAYSICRHFQPSHFFSYTSLFKSLQFIPSYSTYDTLKPELYPNLTTDHKLAYNVWKPMQGFSKKNPPPPDFQICIINTGQNHSFPTLQDIQCLFNQINHTFPSQNNDEGKKSKEDKPKKTSSSQPTKREIKQQRQKERAAKLDPKIQKRNEYLKQRDHHLKNGLNGRTLMLAVIDNGVISFNKLSEADFTLNNDLTVSNLNDLAPERYGLHGTMYLEKI